MRRRSRSSTSAPSTATAKVAASIPPQKPSGPTSFAAQLYAIYAPSMYSAPCALLKMRVTPKMSDRPADRKNSDEAFARPLRAWSRNTSSDSLLLRRPHLPHFGVGRLHRRAVDEVEVLHGALAVLDRRLADSSPHGAPVIDGAVGDRRDGRVELEARERSDHLLRIGAARLLD